MGNKKKSVTWCDDVNQIYYFRKTRLYVNFLPKKGKTGVLLLGNSTTFMVIKRLEDSVAKG